MKLEAFLRLYHEDGLGKLIKNPEFALNDTYKVFNKSNTTYFNTRFQVCESSDYLR